MMDIIQSLKEEGWYLSADGVSKLNENGSANIKTIISRALNVDLRDIGDSCFPDDITKGKLDLVPGNIVVQVQKVKNVSAPKANEESRAAPRMLKVTLTDGHTVCQAVELEQVASLSLNTPPGTKVLLKGETLTVAHGTILLKASTTKVLGGVVPQLIEKWELHRSLAKHTRGNVGEEGGPPPWISFGQKIIRPNLQDRNFKSLDDGKDNKENAEFEAQRKDAIAEAARGGAKKVFGGGNAKGLVDKNVKQIVEMGFTLQQAEHALQQTKNSVIKAIKLLQRREGGGGTVSGNTGGRGGRRRGGDREEEGGGGGGASGGSGPSGGGPKPSGKVSLFDYLEDKLPTQNEKESESFHNNYQSNYGHNYSNSSNSHQRNTSNSSSQGQRGSGHDGRGNKGRGGYNAGSDNRQSRDERNQSQKPPRFQNQQRYQDSTSYSNWSYNSNNNSNNNDVGGYDSASIAAPVKRNYSNTRGNRSQGHDDSYNENFNRQTRHQSNHMSSTYQPNDYNRSSNRRYDNSVGGGGAHNSGSGSNNVFRSSNINNDNISRQLIEAGMPEIPEFPFKNAPAIPSLMSTVPGYYPPAGCNTNSQVQHQHGPPPPPQMNPPIRSQPPPTQHTSPYSGGNKDLANMDQSILWQWKVGDKCMAKYWEDNMYYNAEVTGVSTKTCVVRFLEYGNFEEVLQLDCIPISEERPNAHPTERAVMNSVHHNPVADTINFSGVLEFRRAGTRPFVKSMDIERNHRKNQPRSSQPMYVPPQQRKEPQSSAYK